VAELDALAMKREGFFASGKGGGLRKELYYGRGKRGSGSKPWDFKSKRGGGKAKTSARKKGKSDSNRAGKNSCRKIYRGKKGTASIAKGGEAFSENFWGGGESRLREKGRVHFPRKKREGRPYTLSDGL